MKDANLSGGKRLGRPAGSPPNRQAILDAARRQFVEHGYEGATMRRIAAAAGVDAALVHHYFGSKDDLLLAAVQPAADAAFPDDPGGGVDQLGERLLRATFEVHDALHNNGSETLAGLIRAAVVHEGAARLLREGAAIGQIARLIERLNLSHPRLRAALVASELYGLAVARFVVRIEPIASASAESVISWYAPTIQRHLTEPLADQDNERHLSTG